MNIHCFSALSQSVSHSVSHLLRGLHLDSSALPCLSKSSLLLSFHSSLHSQLLLPSAFPPLTHLLSSISLDLSFRGFSLFQVPPWSSSTLNLLPSLSCFPAIFFGMRPLKEAGMYFGVAQPFVIFHDISV